MNVAVAYRTAVEDIKRGMECPTDFACCRSDSGGPCPTRVVAPGQLLECLADSHQTCKFAVDFGLGRFCECPLQTFMLHNPSCHAGARA